MVSLDEFLSEWNNISPYIKAFTSGSTGIPKEIHLLKADMVSSAKSTNAFFGIDKSSVLALPLSLDYIAGKMMAVRAIQASCRLLTLPISKDISLTEPVDLISIVPMQIDSLLKIDGAGRFVKNILIGGAPLSEIQEKAIVQSGLTGWLGYGMTETCSHVAIRRVGGDGVFHAMPDISFSTDNRGALIISSNRFSWHTITTNDIVRLESPTTFRWIGRADNIVNSGGVKLCPEILEIEYRQYLPDLPPFYLVGEPDSSLGERLVMVMEGSSGKIPEEIFEHLRQTISNHQLLPKRIIAVNTLPTTANGKVLRLKPTALYEPSADNRK